MWRRSMSVAFVQQLKVVPAWEMVDAVAPANRPTGEMI